MNRGNEPRNPIWQSIGMVLACVLLHGPLFGQQPAGSNAPGDADVAVEAQQREQVPPEIESLQERLETLRAKLKAEKAGLASLRQTQQEEVAKLEQRRADLAGRLLDVQIAAERNRGRLDAAQQQAQQTRERAEALAKLVHSTAGALRDAAEQLRIHLTEVPGSDVAVSDLRAISGSLARSNEDDPAPPTVAVDSVLALMDRAYRQGNSVIVQPVTIYTAGGQREQVQLLAVGHARFAYVTTEGQRVGLALSSPRDVSGYRWTEQLSSDQQQQVRDAVNSLAAQQPGWVSVPIDPTGSMQPDALAQESTLWSRFASGGAVMYPLAAIALAGILLICERVYQLYVANATDEKVVVQVLHATRERDFETAQQHAKSCRGAVGAVLTACLARRDFGQRAMEDSIQEQLLHEMPRLQRFISGIATVAAVAPLLGLLGTVTGIIRTFGVIRAFGNATPSLMAGGISEALVTTATGLIIAVPILICHSVLRGRAERILADAERHAASLLTTLTSAAHGAALCNSDGHANDSQAPAKKSEGAGVA